MIEPSCIQQQGNSFNANEAFPKVCDTKTEIGKFLEEKYGRYQKAKDFLPHHISIIADTFKRFATIK